MHLIERGRWFASTFALVAMATMANGGETSPENAKGAREGTIAVNSASRSQPMHAHEAKTAAPLAAQYCEAVRDAAGEARYAFQMAQLESLSKQIDDRLEKMSLAQAELKTWLTKREAFSNQVTAQLVSIFSAMRPDAASEKLAKLEAMMAAAILSKLEARSASAILNEMPTDRAAVLTSILAASSIQSGNSAKR